MFSSDFEVGLTQSNVLLGLLPELLAQTNMTQTGTNRMREEVSKLSIWLSRNCERYFRTEYVPAENYY